MYVHALFTRTYIIHIYVYVELVCICMCIFIFIFLVQVLSKIRNYLQLLGRRIDQIVSEHEAELYKQDSMLFHLCCSLSLLFFPLFPTITA